MISRELRRRLEQEGSRETLQEVLQAHQLTSEILHHFALDCARRAMLRAEQAAQPWAPHQLRVLETKQRWLEGSTSDEALRQARTAAWDAQAKASIPWYAADPVAQQAATDTSEAAAKAAARWGPSSSGSWKARVAEAKAERLWQCRRLAWWLTLVERTERLWLAYTDQCPLEEAPDVRISHGLG